MNHFPHRSIAVLLVSAAAIGQLLVHSPQVALAVGEDVHALACHAVSGYVYEDVNFNGLRDADEAPLPNVAVALYDAADQVIATAQTDATGYYSFTVDTSLIQATQQITYELPVLEHTTDFTQFVSLPKFDPALGDLLGVIITTTGQLTTLVRVENTDTSPQTLVATVAARFTTQGPAIGSVIAQSPLQFVGSFHAGAFDGLIDFKGPSGFIFPTKTVSATSTALLTDSASLNQYIGVGILNMALSTIGSSSAVGSSNVNLLLSTTASGKLLVSYGYLPTRCIKAGSYTIREQQPPHYDDGLDTGGNITPIPDSSGGVDRIPVQVTTGEDRPNNNFGEWRRASLSGFVYHDADDDGVFDGSEAPIADTVIQLTGRTMSGTLVALTQTTTLTGGYSFTGLWPGSYTLTETQPPLWADGKDTQGTPGNGFGTNDQFANIALEPGIDGQDNNFGEQLPVPSLTLVKTVGTLPSVCAGTSVITVAANTPVYYCYTVTNTGPVPLITHTLQDDKLGILLNDVVLNLAPGASTFITAPATIAITTTNVATWTAHPPFGPPATGISTATVRVPPLVANAGLGDFVWMDTDNDGLQDTDEPGAAKTKVTLYANGAPLTTTATTWQGYYSFTHLTAGVPYTLHFDYNMKGGMTWTMRYAGNALKDSNVDKHGNTEPIILAPGEFNSSIDAGIDLGLIVGQVAVDGAASTTPCPDRLITYTLVVDNNGIFTLSDVVLSDTVPTGTQYVENSASVTPIRNDDLLMWQLPTLKPGDRFVVSFVVQVTIEETMTVVNTATIGNTDFPVLATTVNERNLVCNNQPTAISLAKFEALPVRDGVRLYWTTALEQDSFGFALYRGTTNDRAIATRLNPDWIASAGRDSGASYTWLDQSAQAGVSYFYWLQEMELSGALKDYGPVPLSLEMAIPSTASIPIVPAQAGGVAVVMEVAPTALPAQFTLSQSSVVATSAPSTLIAQVVQATLAPIAQPTVVVPTASPTASPSAASNAMPTLVANVDEAQQIDSRADAIIPPTLVTLEIATAKPQSTVASKAYLSASTPAPRLNQPNVMPQAAPITLPIPAFSLMPLALIASAGALSVVVVMWLLIATLSRRR